MSNRARKPLGVCSSRTHRSRVGKHSVAAVMPSGPDGSLTASAQVNENSPELSPVSELFAINDSGKEGCKIIGQGNKLIELSLLKIFLIHQVLMKD